MTLEKARALVAAGFFCLAAALAGGVQAAEVYQGCAQPGPTGKVWYVDPVNGKTPAAGGDGSQTAPWNSLQGVLSFRFPSGYTRPLLSSVPYVHVVDGKRVYVADQLGSPPVQPGDTIELMSGDYGDVVIGDYNAGTYNSDFVTIKPAPSQTPVLTTLLISRAGKFVWDGIKVQSPRNTDGNSKPLVLIGDQGPTYTTSDIIIHGLDVSTADRAVTCTCSQATWQANVRIGIQLWGHSGDGTNGEPWTTCISVTNNHVHYVYQGILMFANKTLVSHNEVDHFTADGTDYGANDLTVTNNYIHDNMTIDANHEDAMQGQNGPLTHGIAFNHFSNILIDSNRIIRQTDQNLQYVSYLQGIDAFDEDWTNVTVTNNVVVTSACWGIFLSSLHNGKIVNNTVVADGLLSMPGNCKPAVGVGDKTHEGPSSSDSIIRNNIANNLNIYNIDPKMTMDHNICLGINGKCQIVTYVNGKPNWGVFKPGMYGDHNIIDRRGADGMFVGFDPAKFLCDLRLRSGAGAIGVGNSAEAPPVDITGTRRGSRIDVGAYQYSPDK
jgi:parallel beta-helix repeat protein